MVMQFIAMLVLSLSAAACASGPGPAPEKLTADEQRLASTFQSVNRKIYGDVATGAPNQMAGFSLSAYEGALAALRSDRAESLRRYLKDCEQLVFASAETFVTCLYSRKGRLAICDDARCEGIEKTGRGEFAIVESLKSGLPLKDCPKYSSGAGQN